MIQGPQAGRQASAWAATCSAHPVWGGHVGRPRLQLSPAPPAGRGEPGLPHLGLQRRPDAVAHPGGAPSPRDCVAAELSQPLGVVAHGSVEHADRVVAAVGVGLQVKLAEGQ